MANTTFSGPVISTNGFITTSTITASSAILGGNTISGTELGYIDGVTAGTAAANKAVVLNGSKGITTITSATITTVTAPTIKTATVQASDASAAATIANSTGIITIAGGLAITEAKDISVGTTTGTKIGTAAAQKLGFYNATPVIQQATTGTTSGFVAGSGTASKDDSTFTGGSGTKAYTVGDVVLALKNLGLLAAS
jgi:hypothetical protein